MDSTSRDLLSQIFDVIQSDVALQKQVDLEHALILSGLMALMKQKIFIEWYGYLPIWMIREYLIGQSWMAIMFVSTHE